MVQRPRPDLRGGCAAMRIPTATAGGAGKPASLPRPEERQNEMTHSGMAESGAGCSQSQTEKRQDGEHDTTMPELPELDRSITRTCGPMPGKVASVRRRKLFGPVAGNNG